MNPSPLFANLALLSMPSRSGEINALAAEQKKLQDQLQDLRKRQAELTKKEPAEELSDEELKDATGAAAALKDILAKLIVLARGAVPPCG